MRRTRRMGRKKDHRTAHSPLAVKKSASYAVEQLLTSEEVARPGMGSRDGGEEGARWIGQSAPACAGDGACRAPQRPELPAEAGVDGDVAELLASLL